MENLNSAKIVSVGKEVENKGEVKMTTNIMNISDEELSKNMYDLLTEYPGIKDVAKKLCEEVENSYEYYEGDEDEIEYFTFRFFGIKLRANKPKNPNESEDLILDNMLKFTDFMRSAKDFDMKVSDKKLIQKIGYSFDIYGKKDPNDKNSRYTEWLGYIKFDVDNDKEFMETLDDFETLFIPALGGKPDKEKIEAMIRRRG